MANKKEILEELKLLKLLNANHLSVSFPIPDKNKSLIQNINASEGFRYLVVCSFAEGEKVRFMSNDTCFEIGSLMAKIHALAENKNIDRLLCCPKLSL